MIKRFFQKIIQWMIKIGSTIIDTIKIGTSTPQHIDVGSVQVWPDGQPAIYLNLSPTTVQPWNGYYRTGTITVDTNASSWSVAASSTPAGNFFSATKTNSTTVTWVMQENSGTTSRNGYVTVTAGSVSAQTVVYQNPGYYIYVDNNNPTVLNSGSTTLAVSVWSRYGNEAVPVTYQITGNDWVHYLSTTDAGGGHYIFNFSVDTNTDTQTRHNGITFTQTLGSSTPYKSVSLGITQQAMYVPETIAGFERFTYEGDWQLGRALYGTAEINNQTVPLYAILLLNTNATNWNYTATLDFDSQVQVPPSAPSSSTTNTTATITAGATISIPNGGTAYGIMIKSPSPNQRITNVRTLHVERATT